MMGLQPSHRQAALFTYRTDLDSRVGADHLLRRVAATLDLEFVPAAVRHCYGRSGHVSLDPRLVMKLLLLLFLYNIPSERELMEQVGVRLDFLWFLGLDLESDIPDHSVLSKARRRWGEAVFEQLFVRMVEQCVAAGLVEGRLLHIDSTMVRAQAHRDSVVSSGPELVAALRRAYQQQQTKLEVVVDPPETAAPSAPAKGEPGTGPEGPAELAPELRVLPASAAPPVEVGSAPAQGQESARGKLPVNATHLSTTDPEAELARSKNGRTELNYKHHRLVDDAHGVITAVQETPANVADGSQLPVLYEQHQASTGLKPAQVTVAGDHHYGQGLSF